MAYADFTLSGLTKQFKLSFEERTDLFKDVPEVALRESFQAQLEKTVPIIDESPYKKQYPETERVVEP